jgi:hypothetical protein
MGGDQRQDGSPKLFRKPAADGTAALARNQTVGAALNGSHIITSQSW